MNDLSSFSVVTDKKVGKQDKRTLKATAPVAAAINRYSENMKKLDELQAEINSDGAIIKEAGRVETIDLLKKNIPFQSFKLASTTNGLLYICQNRFAKLDADGHKAAAEIIGEKYLRKTTEYKFNKEMVEKHGSKIAAAIAKLDIPNEDKAKLLVSTDLFEYTFELDEIGQVAKESKVSVDVIFETVKPVQQLKGGK